MKSARRRALEITALFMLVTNLLYVIGANLFLKSPYFFNLINSDPQKLLIDIDSPKTLWPGQINAKKITIKGHNGNVVWFVEAKKVRAQISVLPLFWRALDVHDVQIDEVFTKIDLWQERQPPQPPSERPPFKLKFHNLVINSLKNFQIHTFVFKGQSKLEGAFDLIPGIEFNLWNSNLEFVSGSLNKRDTEVLTNMKAKISGTILDYSPEKDPDIDILDHIKYASTSLSGHLKDPNFINLYLSKIPWLRASQLSGEINTNIEIRNGKISDNTQGEFKANRVDFNFGNLKSESWSVIRWNTKKDELKSDFYLGDFSFPSKLKDKPYAQGKLIKLVAKSQHTNLKELFSGLQNLDLEIGIQKTRVNELSFFNRYIPVSDNLSLRNGHANLDAKLYVSTNKISKKGFIKLRARNALSVFRGLRFNGELNVSSNIQDSDLGIDSFSLTETKIDLKNINVLNPKNSAERKIKNWKGSILVSKALIEPQKKIIGSGNFALSFDNAEPMLVLLGSEFRPVRLLQRFAAINKLNGHGQFKIGPETMSLDSVVMRSSDLELKGRYRFAQKKHRYVGWFRFQTLKAGLDYNGSKLSYSLTNAHEWYLKRPQWEPLESD